MGVNKLVYHGSNEKFSKFDTKYIGQAHGIDAGFGFYFTESKAECLTYGKYIYTCFLNLKRDVSLYQKTFDDNTLRKLILLIEESEFSILDEFESIFDAINFYSVFPNDVEIIKNIITRINDVNIVLDSLIQCGYDYTTDITSPDDDTITHYIVYDVNTIMINNIDAPLGEGDLGSDAPKAQINPLLESEDFQHQLSKFYQSDYPTNHPTNHPTEYYDDIDSLIDYTDIDDSDLDEDGKAKSKSQRRLFYMALAHKRGELDDKYVSDKVKKLSQLSDETLHDYASTKQKKRKKDGSIGKRNSIPQKVKTKSK